MLKKTIRKVKDIINNIPFLKKILLYIIPKKVIYKIKKVDLKTDNKYKIFYTENKRIFFSLGPLEDIRGIGRVAREQYAYLKRNCKGKDKDSLKNIYFYSSIHWAPEDLPKNSIVMIHDVIPMRLSNVFMGDNVIWKERYYKIAHKSKHIVTISNTSKEDIKKYLDIEESKLTVINNGVKSFKETGNIKFDIPSNYFVFIGSNDKHKNLIILLKALKYKECENFKLVMIGNNQDLKKEVENQGVNDKVIFLGKLADEEMVYVIKNSIALLFPSLYEGFGLPPMEAALLKVPSICSNRPTMTEFLKGVTLYADVHDAKDWATKMNILYNDKNLREDLAQKAFQRVSQFTWDSSGKKLLELLDRI